MVMTRFAVPPGATLPLAGDTESQPTPLATLAAAWKSSWQVPLLERTTVMGDGFGPPSSRFCEIGPMKPGSLRSIFEVLSPPQAASSAHRMILVFMGGPLRTKSYGGLRAGPPRKSAQFLLTPRARASRAVPARGRGRARD